MGSTDEPVVEVRGVRATYRRGRATPRTALDGVDLTLHHGESLALLGPNGSGKSTLLRLLCGLARADAGLIRVLGSENPADYRRELGVVFQSPALDPHLTVTENLVDQARLYGISTAEAGRRVADGLEALDLSDRANDLVRTLSGGMKRRADLCRALLHRPRLLLLDEPTTGLDPVSRRQFLEHLDDRRRLDELAILMSTHLVDEAESLDRVVLLDDGRVIADDTPAALRAELGARRVTVLDPSFEPDDGNDGWSRTAGRFARPIDDMEIAPVARDLAERGYAFTVAPPDLGDVFATRTGHALVDDGATEAAP